MSNHDEQYRQIGLNIAHYRKLKRLSQEKLAEMISISRGHLGHIEAPNMTTYFSIATLLDIAEALEIEPKKLLEFN